MLIVYRMGRLCGGAHEISGINPLTTEPQAIFLLLENDNLGIIKISLKIQ